MALYSKIRPKDFLIHCPITPQYRVADYYDYCLLLELRRIIFPYCFKNKLTYKRESTSL